MKPAHPYLFLRYPLLLATVLLAALLWTLPCAAQVDTTAVDTARIPVSQIPPPGRMTDSSTGGEFVMTKDPTTAILFSIVPGGGQFYNEQYWKIPLFAGTAGYFIYRVISYHNLFREKADQTDSVGRDNPGYSRLKLEREFYRDERDLNAAYFLGVEILNMIDAYVGAHMFDFDVDDEVSSRIYLDPLNNSVGLSIRW